MRLAFTVLSVLCVVAIGCDPLEVQEPEIEPAPADLPADDAPADMWSPCPAMATCAPWGDDDKPAYCLSHVGVGELGEIGYVPWTTLCVPLNFELGDNCELAPAPLAGAAQPLPYAGGCASPCTTDNDCPSGMLCSAPWVEAYGVCGHPKQ